MSAFQCSYACFRGVQQTVSTWTAAMEFCSARPPRPQNNMEKSMGSTAEAQAAVFHDTGCKYTKNSYYYNLHIAVAAMKRLWWWSGTEVVSFYSCRSHRHWICLDLVHKTLNEKNYEGTMLIVHHGQAYKLCIGSRLRDFSLFFFLICYFLGSRKGCC